MYQVSSPYRRKNIGPLTAYGRFRGYNRSARRYNRGWRRPGAWGAIATYRGRPNISRPISSYNNITSIVKTVLLPVWTYPGSTSTASFKSWAFSFSDLSDASSYTGIFDQYRIVGVRVTFVQRQNVVRQDGSSTVQNTAKYAFICTDMDDATAPSSMDTLQGYANCKTWKMLEQNSFNVFLRPQLSNAAWAGGTFSGYTSGKGGYRGPWCDSNNTGIQYYGVKGGIQLQGGVTEGEFTVDVIAKYYIQLKGQR